MEMKTSKTLQSFTPFRGSHESPFARRDRDHRMLPSVATVDNLREMKEWDVESSPRSSLKLSETGTASSSTPSEVKEYAFPLYIGRSSLDSWKQHYHSPHNPLAGILYANFCYMGKPIDEIERDHQHHRKWMIYDLIKNKGYFEIPFTYCPKCKKTMSVVLVFRCGGDSYMRDIYMNKNEVVCPLIMGKVMYLAHSSCVNLSRNTIFKVLERRLSFRKWWTQMNPWKEILGAVFLILIILAILSIVFTGCLLMDYSGKNLTSDHPLDDLLPVIKHYGTFRQEAKIAYALYCGVSFSILIIIAITLCIVSMDFIRRVFGDCFKACRGNYQQMSLELWDYLQLETTV